jgi:hypothetical protein
VQLLDSSNFSSYRRVRRYRSYGGHARRSPVRLPIPRRGHEFDHISLESANEQIIAAAFERALNDDDYPFAARQRMIDTALPYRRWCSRPHSR